MASVYSLIENQKYTIAYVKLLDYTEVSLAIYFNSHLMRSSDIIISNYVNAFIYITQLLLNKVYLSINEHVLVFFFLSTLIQA